MKVFGWVSKGDEVKGAGGWVKEGNEDKGGQVGGWVDDRGDGVQVGGWEVMEGEEGKGMKVGENVIVWDVIDRKLFSWLSL